MGPATYSAPACGYVKPGFLNFYGSEGQLYANCKPFAIKGVNWFGSEGPQGVLEGLDRKPLAFFFEFFRRHRFNALRLPFNHKSVSENRPIPVSRISQTHNPMLFRPASNVGIDYIESLKQVVLAAEQQRVLVMLSAHRLAPIDWPGDGLWYSREFPESRLMETWTKLCEEFCNSWNVFAVDISHGTREMWSCHLLLKLPLFSLKRHGSSCFAFSF